MVEDCCDVQSTNSQESSTLGKTTTMSKLDLRELRRAFGTFLTGVTVVTTTGPDKTPVGFTANSYTSVSLDPPLLLVCPAKSLGSFKLFESCSHFAINILNESQQKVSNIFASSEEDRFSQVGWLEDPFGCPVFTDVCTSFSCSVYDRVNAGDHIILIGRVESFSTTGKSGLGYSPDGYFSLELERRAKSLNLREHRASVGAIIEHEGAVLLCRTPDGHEPPSVNARHAGSTSAIQQLFQESGLEVQIGPVYSIYDNSETNEFITWYRCHAATANTGSLGDYVPVQQLSSLTYANGAIASMMQRYVTEKTTGVFGLYTGDETRGDVHLFGENPV